MSTDSVAALVPGEIAELRYRPLFAFQIQVKGLSVIGATPGYDRRIGEITGGQFEGERLRGWILSGGSDWQSLRADGATTLNVRLVMETDDNVLIAVSYLGVSAILLACAKYATAAAPQAHPAHLEHGTLAEAAK